MMPWGHLALGYLCLSLGRRALAGRAPSTSPAVALAVATQVPDILDKPVDVWLGAIPGRSFMHSVVFVIPLCLGLVFVARRRGHRETGLAAAVGLLSHLAGDALWPFLTGEPGDATFLLWPVLPVPDLKPDTVGSYLGLVELRLTEAVSPATPLVNPASVDLTLFVVAVAVWVLDGYPGLRTVLAVTRRHKA